MRKRANFESTQELQPTWIQQVSAVLASIEVPSDDDSVKATSTSDKECDHGVASILETQMQVFQSATVLPPDEWSQIP